MLDPARLLAAFGGLAFVPASILLGIRLLLLAARTRQPPELCIGLALLLMGGLGYVLITTARMAVRLGAPARLGLMALAVVLMGVGTLAVVTERVLLWGIASVASAVVGLTSTIAGFLGINFAATAFGPAVTAPLGLVAAGSMWLAFLPPAAYLRRVEARAAAAAAAG